MNPYQQRIASERQESIRCERELVRSFLASNVLTTPQHDVAYAVKFHQSVFDADDNWDEFHLQHCAVDPTSVNATAAMISAWSIFFGVDALAQRWIEVERIDKSTVLVRVRYAWYLQRRMQRELVKSSSTFGGGALQMTQMFCCKALPTLIAATLFVACIGLVFFLSSE